MWIWIQHQYCSWDKCADTTNGLLIIWRWFTKVEYWFLSDLTSVTFSPSFCWTTLYGSQAHQHSVIRILLMGLFLTHPFNSSWLFTFANENHQQASLSLPLTHDSFLRIVPNIQTPWLVGSKYISIYTLRVYILILLTFLQFIPNNPRKQINRHWSRLFLFFCLAEYTTPLSRAAPEKKKTLYTFALFT